MYYPDFLLGEWLVSSELYSVETAQDVSDAPMHAALGKQAVRELRARVGRRDFYHIRFIEHDGKVIEDRAFDAKQVAKVEYPAMKVSTVWNADNPNVFSLAGAGAATSLKRELKITKRSFVDAPQGYGTFVASEYARVVDIDDDGALLGFGKPPSIYGARRITYVQRRVFGIFGESIRMWARGVADHVCV